MSEQNKLLTLGEEWSNALAIVAHPDDLEYGTAAAIARWTNLGKRVAYVLITSGEAGIDSIVPEKTRGLREEEELNSARVVGVDDVTFLNHRDGVIEYGLPLRRDIARAIRQHQPEVVITLSYHLKWARGALNMADHRAVGLASLDASRDAGNRWIFPELIDEGLSPWNGVRKVYVGGSPYPTHAVDVTDYIDRAVASLEEHRVYIDNLGQDFDPDTFLRMNANAVGESFGCDYAVSFEVIDI